MFTHHPQMKVVRIAPPRHRQQQGTPHRPDFAASRIWLPDTITATGPIYIHHVLHKRRADGDVVLRHPANQQRRHHIDRQCDQRNDQHQRSRQHPCHDLHHTQARIDRHHPGDTQVAPPVRTA